jgi:hypothetical protein
MVVEEPMDFGGTSINIEDIISDDVISKIKGLNPDLGVEGKDPLYDRYAQYRDEIENAELIIIDANSLNRSSIMNLDLSGDMSGVEELPADYFQMRDDTLEFAFGDPFDINDIGGNEYEGFEEFSAFGETEFSPFTNGIYE